MLSSVLPPVDNIQVGQHPYVIRLLKGIFNSRPPKVKLVPEWELPIVLAKLQEPPFEPLRTTALKYLTFKVVFLTAITTFRRCGDLQALRLGEGNISVQDRGVTFLRSGLAKQDRPAHFGSKIFVPAFKENKKLDPKRALAIYLSRTEQFRTTLSKTDELCLFLSYIKPHKPVTSQTIANWITEAIKICYSKKLKVNAHSTRSLGPSWALFKGASMSSIMKAADWSRENTFTKFYLRNVENSVLLKD